MSIHFSELVAQLDMPALYTNIADNKLSLDHGAYPAAMAVEPDPRLVYIGHCDEVTELAIRFKDCGQTLSFITRDTNDILQSIAKASGFNLLCVQGSTAQLYYITNSILSAAGEVSYPNNPVNRFVAELVEDKIETTLELSSKAIDTGMQFKNRFVLMLITPEEGLSEKFYRTIESLGLGFALSIYRGSLIIFFEAEQTGEEPEFKKAELERILTKFNAYAAISNTSTTLTSVSLYYQQCKDTIRMGKDLGIKRLGSAEDSNDIQPSRIFYNSDFLIYEAIDTLAATIRYKHNKITYLTSPLLMKLYRYDKQHNDNIYKVTEAYIESGNNISETASKLFLHRNTVTNKLAKAEAIMERSFNDVSLCYSLYFSFMIYHYVEKTWGIDADTILPTPKKAMQ